MMERREYRVQLDPKDPLGQLDLLENKGCKELLVFLDQREIPEKWVPRDCWGKLANLERRV